MPTVDNVGRKPIQSLTFTMNALFLSILAGAFNTLRHQTGPFLVVFDFLQLFFNLGPNATTFIVPAEAFPTRVRATAHGVGAACAKCGATLSSLSPALRSRVQRLRCRRGATVRPCDKGALRAIQNDSSNTDKVRAASTGTQWTRGTSSSG